MNSIEFKDIYEVATKISGEAPKRPFSGILRIIQDGEVQPSKFSKEGWLSNMVIGSGREFAAQKLAGIAPTTTKYGNLLNHKLNAFGVGSGGSIIDNSGEILYQGPKTCDTNLYKPVPINNSAFSYSGFNEIVKEVTSIGAFGREAGTITFDYSDNIEFKNCSGINSVLKLFCVIDEGEPLFDQNQSTIKIDEAMLFATVPDTVNSNRKPVPFAHVCFSPKYIELKTKLYIEWYILF